MGLCQSANVAALEEFTPINMTKKDLVYDFFYIKHAGVYNPSVLKSPLFKKLQEQFCLINMLFYVNDLVAVPKLPLEKFSNELMPNFKVFYKTRTNPEDILICATFNYYFFAVLREFYWRNDNMKRVIQCEKSMGTFKMQIEKATLAGL